MRTEEVLCKVLALVPHLSPASLSYQCFYRRSIKHFSLGDWGWDGSNFKTQIMICKEDLSMHIVISPYLRLYRAWVMHFGSSFPFVFPYLQLQAVQSWGKLLLGHFLLLVNLCIQVSRREENIHSPCSNNQHDALLFSSLARISLNFTHCTIAFLVE